MQTIRCTFFYPPKIWKLELLNLKSHFNKNEYFNKSYVQFFSHKYGNQSNLFIKKEKMHGKQHEKGAFVPEEGCAHWPKGGFHLAWHTTGFELETFLEVLRSLSMGYMDNIYYIYTTELSLVVSFVPWPFGVRPLNDHIRASPTVLSMWLHTLQFIAKRSKCVGLAQEIGFSAHIQMCTARRGW